LQRLQTFKSVLSSATRRRGAAILGVCNVTPDSFSDGGMAYGFDAAVAHADMLLREGADIIDIGGESTRPGAPSVSAAEQLARILEVVRHVSKHAFVSVDTTLPEVLEACLNAGAHAVNDVSCARDPDLAGVAAKYGAVYMLMHARGTQTEMLGFSAYADDAYPDVVSDVVREWTRAKDVVVAQGVDASAIVFDPGYGFAKNAKQSLTLLQQTRTLCERIPFPLLSGSSRKSFLRFADEGAAPADRLGASLAAASYAIQHGAKLVRVHDVQATHQALMVDARLRRPAEATC
jgi:dihydropteroate synthase